MRFVVTVILGLTLLAVCAMAYETEIFMEDFSGDLDENWLPYGSPRPVIMEGVGNPFPSFKNNGDSMYRSGAVSKITFDYSGILVIEADYRVTGYNLNGCWVAAGTGLLKNYNYNDSLSPGFSVAFNQSWAGAACRSGSREGVLSYSLITTAEAVESLALNPMNDYIGDWHTFRIIIDSNNYVTYYVDGQLIFSSLAPMSANYNNMPIVLAHNSISSYGEALHDNIRVVQTKQLIWDIVVAFGISFPEADVLYNLFAEEELLDALLQSEGDWNTFMSRLFPPSEEAGKARLAINVAESGDSVELTVKNVGNSACSGALVVSAGLSYDTSWIPEWCTQFFENVFGDVTLNPGEQISISFDLPDVPSEIVELLAQRLSDIWTEYVDKDPAKDYVGIVASMGGAYPAFAFLPR